MEKISDKSYKNSILGKIFELKHKVFGSTAVKCMHRDQEFEIILLTAGCAEDINMMELLGKWRKENEQWYLSQFPVSTERTTRWFTGRLIEVPDRLLFIIKMPAKFIGHVGLFRFDFRKQICEIDNILRGEKDYPGIMGRAVECLMDWARNNLELKGFSLKVLSDNHHAINFYRNLRFREVLRIPLMQVGGKDGLEWVEAPQDFKGEAERYYVVMESV